MTQHSDIPDHAAEENHNDGAQGSNRAADAPADVARSETAAPSQVDEPAQDAIMPGKEAGAAAIERISELALALQADLKRTAAALEVGEFAASGSGHPGSLFRAVQALKTGSPDHVEAWSILLEVAESLWAEDCEEASLAFVRSAHLSLSTPEIFEDRVNSALEIAENALLVRRAEKRFSEGDLDGAVGIARKLKGGDAPAYVEELNLRQSQRRRSRMMAFAFSGAAILGLSAVSLSGIMQIRDLVQNPPTVSLPDFPDTGILEDLKNARLIEGDLPNVEDLIQKFEEENAGSKTAVSAAAGPEIEFVEDVEEKSANTEQTSVQSAPTEPPIDLGMGQASPTASVSSNPGPETKPSQKPASSHATAEMIYNCALGQAVSKRAIELVIASGNQAKAGPVEAFVKKVNAACAALDTTQAEIDAVVVQIPKAQIDTIAKNIAP